MYRFPRLFIGKNRIRLYYDRSGNVPEHQDCTDAENEFRCTLRVSQSVERENHIQDQKCRNLQDQLPHDRKQKSISSESQCLEDTHRQKVHADKADAKSESMENRVPYAMIASLFINRLMSVRH